jgi:hypothetical protein
MNFTITLGYSLLSYKKQGILKVLVVFCMSMITHSNLIMYTIYSHTQHNKHLVELPPTIATVNDIARMVGG